MGQDQNKLQKALEDIIWATAAIAEARDPYTAGHMERVTNLSLVVSNEIGLPEEEKQELRMAAIVHDLGKVFVPSEILSKPGRLNDIEFSMIKMHSQAGYDIFKNVDLPWPIADILLQHHERMDGSGYPMGLRGDNILQAARIIAVADVVEAMSSHRPYRPALGLDRALDEITEKRGKLYDADVVDAFLNLFKEEGLPVPQIASEHLETIARVIHEDYQNTQRGKLADDDPSMAEWENLTGGLKVSNRQQAEHIMKKLSRVSCTVHKVAPDKLKLMTFTEEEVDMMAEMEHQRWYRDKLFDGWVLGEERDAVKKISPYLVPSSELPDDIRDLDRQMVLNMPGLLASIGLEIHRQSGAGERLNGGRADG